MCVCELCTENDPPSVPRSPRARPCPDINLACGDRPEHHPPRIHYRNSRAPSADSTVSSTITSTSIQIPPTHSLNDPRLYCDLHAPDRAQISTSRAEIDLNDTPRGFINETRALPTRLRPLHRPLHRSPLKPHQPTLKMTPIRTAISAREIAPRYRPRARRSI